MRFPLRQTIPIARYIHRMKRAGVSRFPLVLMLEPLHACNLTCSGCGRIREYREHLSKMLALNECFRAIDACGAPVVSICGGEPLLYPQVQPLVEGALARGRVVYLCTNGQQLAEKLTLLAPHPRFNINVHLDGLEATHDSIVERAGAFDRAVSGIVAAKRAGFCVCTNTTVYRQTEPEEIVALIEYLDGLGIDGILLSPAFDYSDAPDPAVFMSREAIVAKFAMLREAGRGRRIMSTPIFLDFLAGRRELACTPWGNVTYNVRGWKAPCYLITDGHYATFDEFLKGVDWERYGPGRDPRCANCMAHCGFEPTVALAASSSFADALTMMRWTLL
jgi:hopanoid biosynthesis associated radical SAM protein HpnH